MNFTSSVTKFDTFDLQPGRKIAGKYKITSGFKWKIKRTLTSEELSKRYWNELYYDENPSKIIMGKGKRLRKMNAKSEEFFDLYFPWELV